MTTKRGIRANLSSYNHIMEAYGRIGESGWAVSLFKETVEVGANANVRSC